MGEIKSTLNLVMERTKNLTMNADEKEKQRETELKRTGWSTGKINYTNANQ